MKELNANQKLLLVSAIITIAGIILSGPIGILITQIKPQPAWQGENIFVANYHYVQTLPYVFGFILLFGFTLFISASYSLASSKTQKVYRLMALVFVSVYAAMIGINYAVQIVLVPALLSTNQQLVGLFTMSNPNSIGWIFEMFGYGFLGVATIFIAPVFRKGLRMKIIRYLLIANGVISILGAAATAFGTSWLMAWSGITCVVVWNILILVIMSLVVIEFWQVKADN